MIEKEIVIVEDSNNESDDDDLVLGEEIIIEIQNLRYGKKNIIVEALYNDIPFRFSVFWTNKHSSADNKFSFKILDKHQQLKAPDYKLIAKFDITKSGYLKCLTARVLE